MNRYPTIDHEYTFNLIELQLILICDSFLINVVN